MQQFHQSSMFNVGYPDAAVPTTRPVLGVGIVLTTAPVTPPTLPVTSEYDPEFGKRVQNAYQVHIKTQERRIQKYGTKAASKSRHRFTPSPVREEHWQQEADARLWYLRMSLSPEDIESISSVEDYMRKGLAADSSDSSSALATSTTPLTSSTTTSQPPIPLLEAVELAQRTQTPFSMIQRDFYLYGLKPRAWPSEHAPAGRATSSSQHGVSGHDGLQHKKVENPAACTDTHTTTVAEDVDNTVKKRKGDVAGMEEPEKVSKVLRQ